MKKTGFTLLLILLKGLIYIKRALVWLFGILWYLITSILNSFNRSIGFHLYKIVLRIKKVTGRIKIPWDSRLVEFWGKRSTLQAVLFIVCIIVMIPHSKLYTKEPSAVAGQKTLLYELVGPGYQDFATEEIALDVTAFEGSSAPAWREGSVGSISPNTAGLEIPRETQEIAGLGAGGTALTKPSILPGLDLPTDATIDTTGRTNIVYYTVEPGDIIGAIAEKYRISVVTILWANNLTTRSYIQPGDELKILPVDGLIHKVKSGDTVSKIASTYGAKIEDIVMTNRLQKDGRDIVIGEELLVPGGEKPQPVPVYTVSAPSAFRSVAAPPPSVNAPAGSGYLWPAGVRYISQYYGWRHTGLDIAGPIGTPIYASRSGTIIKSQCGYNGGYGCYIIIDHGDGVKTLYGHASELYVSVGDYVSQGQTIMAMGSTGRSTGPHVHFEVKVNGSYQNPLQYVR
ncbi:M23 family metallopeptidase [Patescibacteria group bacterium]|nr:M23 family metallopeptidase [Patescibacteria group bacterium]MBU1895857.1 M23 family metallopeptidase [Patescibacteria group bacterium]